MSDRDRPGRETPTRRTFCVQAGQAVSVVTIGAILPACGGGGGNPASPSPAAPALPSVNGAVAGNQVTVTIGAGSPLATIGSSALVAAGGNTLLVTRDTQTTFTALTATCTHEQCTVSGISGGSFVCPCHGSRYSTGGAVLNGPATQALRQFQSQFVDPTLTITI